jgi:hypothetical protein
VKIRDERKRGQSDFDDRWVAVAFYPGRNRNLCLFLKSPGIFESKHLVDESRARFAYFTMLC